MVFGIYLVFICYHLLSCYNSFLVYCRELVPGTVSLTGDRAQGDDSKHDSHYNAVLVIFWVFLAVVVFFCLGRVFMLCFSCC